MIIISANVFILFLYCLEKFIFEIKVKRKRKIWQKGGKTPVDYENNVYKKHKFRKSLIYKFCTVINLFLIFGLIIS